MDKQSVINALVSMSSTTDWPFTVQQVGEKVEISYNLADARWIEFYGVGSHKKALKLLLAFDEAGKRVKYTIVEGEVTLDAGLPVISWNIGGFKGQKWGYSSSTAIGLSTEGKLGVLYSYTVNYGAIPNDVKKVIEPLGWTVVRDFSDPSVMIAIFFAVLGGLGAIATICILGISALLR
jgi:hypothetical protein